jgi:hypothetical protein
MPLSLGRSGFHSCPLPTHEWRPENVFNKERWRGFNKYTQGFVRTRCVDLQPQNMLCFEIWYFALVPRLFLATFLSLSPNLSSGILAGTPLMFRRSSDVIGLEICRDILGDPLTDDVFINSFDLFIRLLFL